MVHRMTDNMVKTEKKKEKRRKKGDIVQHYTLPETGKLAA